jgi:hypothetical protein
MDYVEAWFDNHPEPENIDCHSFSFIEIKDTKVDIFFADQIHNTFMIKITSKTAKRSLYLSKLLYKTTCQMGIDQILINNKLFLLTDLRF